MMNELRLDEYGIYTTYLACKLHFSSDTYDARKYNFKTRANPNSFWKRKDRYYFYKIGTRFDFKREPIINYFSAYFADGVEWVGDMIADDGPWEKWKRRMQSLSYEYENDINNLHDEVDTFDELFESPAGQHPLVISKYLTGDISLETVVILNKLIGFVPGLPITETLVWPELKMKILKYGSMIDEQINSPKFKKITLKVFTS